MTVKACQQEVIVDCECLSTGSPAERAGVEEGQILIAINGANVLTLTHDEIVTLITNSQSSCCLSLFHSHCFILPSLPFPLSLYSSCPPSLFHSACFHPALSPFSTPAVSILPSLPFPLSLYSSCPLSLFHSACIHPALSPFSTQPVSILPSLPFPLRLFVLALLVCQ